MPIRPYLHKDKENLLAFIATYSSATRAKTLCKYWDWQIANNPFTLKSGSTILLLEEDGQVVGSLLSYPLPMKINHREITANCMMDFIVHPNYRGGGIGLALQTMRLES